MQASPTLACSTTLSLLAPIHRHGKSARKYLVKLFAFNLSQLGEGQAMNFSHVNCVGNVQRSDAIGTDGFAYDFDWIQLQFNLNLLGLDDRLTVLHFVLLLQPPHR
jgi:hypothetical protein